MTLDASSPGLSAHSGRRESTCYHEAGHAVAGWALGFPIKSVIVMTGEQMRAGGPEGLVDYGVGWGTRAAMMKSASDLPLHKRRILSKSERDGHERFLVANLAGIMAESRFTGIDLVSCHSDGGQDDAKNFEAILRGWFSGKERQEAAASLAFKRTCGLLRMEATWQAVSAVAGALLKCGELSFEQVDAPCSAAFLRAQPDEKAVRGAWANSLFLIEAGRWPPAVRC
jgi:hypothetical protein